MSRSLSLLDKLDALDEMADSKLPHLHEPPASVAPIVHERQVSSLPNAGPGAQSDIYTLLQELKRDITMLQKEQHEPPPSSSQEQHLYGLLAELKRDVEVLRREQTAQSLPPGERQLYALLAELRADIKTLENRPENPRRPSTVHAGQPLSGDPVAARANVFGRVSVLWLLALLPLALISGYLIEHGMSGLTASKSSPSEIATRPSQSPQSASRLYDALASGAASPRGGSAADVGESKALARASQALGGPARDTGEASYWLKRYLAQALSDGQVARALTQLGSAQADANGKPADIVKARNLWEMASAAGDPVAMCFMGRLYEAGMSVPASKQEAYDWFARAKKAGGCAEVDDALARLRP